METGSIDLYGPAFWLFSGAGVLAGYAIVSAPLRRAALALLNAGFLYFLCGPEGAAWIAVGVGAAYGLLRINSRPGASGAWFWGTLGALAVLFVVHKLGAAALGWQAPEVNPLLVAIGFSYTALRYVDVLRGVRGGDFEPPDFVRFVNFLLPFHMLAAGPIQAYEDFRDQPDLPAPLTFRESLGAVERVVFGLFKKFVLAQAVQEIFLTGFYSTGWMFLLEVQFFFLWLYLDFSAYSDIAVGLGRLMGVRTPENFDRPYFARNLIEFWDRWHISLSLFVRRNLFIPIQLMLVRGMKSQRPVLSASISFLVSFLFVGVWHSIEWKYFAWGAMHALGLVAVNTYRFGLKARLGTEGLKRYRENLWIRLAAGVATYEYVAWSLVLIAFPWGG